MLYSDCRIRVRRKRFPIEKRFPNSCTPQVIPIRVLPATLYSVRRIRVHRIL